MAAPNALRRFLALSGGALLAMIAWVRRRFFKGKLPADISDARRLVTAIDRGGIPLNPAKVNAIARNLGLEVSARAPVEQTIERIRACLQRVDAVL